MIATDDKKILANIDLKNKFIKYDESMKRISEHVWLLPYDENTDRPNLGYIESKGEAFLFDVGCGPKSVELLKTALAKNDQPWPTRALISHFHWDHCFASGCLDCRLFASAYTAEKMAEMLDFMPEDLDQWIDEERFMPEFCKEHLHLEYQSGKDVKLRAIDEIVKDGDEFIVGDLHLKVVELISPHCDGQLGLYVVEDRILFVGDAQSGKIVGFDFIEDQEKRCRYNQQLSVIDFDKIVVSHYEVLSKEDYYLIKDEI